MRRLVAAALAVLLVACAQAPTTPTRAGGAAPEASSPDGELSKPAPAPRELEGAEVGSILPLRSDLVVRGERSYWLAVPGHEYEILRAREGDWLALAARPKEVGELLPRLYLHGLSQGDFELALRGLLGEGAPLSSSSIERLRCGPRSLGMMQNEHGRSQPSAIFT